VYARIDEFVGKLRSVVGDDVNVLLVSDHGAKRIDGEIHMNSLLEKWGYLNRTEQSAGGPTELIKNSLLSLGWKIGRTVPPDIKKMLKKLISEGTVDEMESAVGYGQQNMVKSIDWSVTDAFSYGYMGRVFLHDEEAYPFGTLSSAERDEMKDELTERLLALRHPETGDRLVEDVLTKEEVYDGPSVANAPDLLIVPTNWQYMIYGDFGDEWINSPSLRIADHDPEGVLITAGPDINSGSVNANIADIAPTILSLHDLPILEGMDGRWLDELVSDSEPPTTAPDDVYLPEQSDGVADSEMVTERLEDLGYL
jgi:predicted AlkP superfamily phosphohydrolase/phosphomutase